MGGSSLSVELSGFEECLLQKKITGCYLVSEIKENQQVTHDPFPITFYIFLRVRFNIVFFNLPFCHFAVAVIKFFI